MKFRELQIKRPDERSMEAAKARWDQIAKPLHSLGLLEDGVVQMAGIYGTPDIPEYKKALVVMCADNGVVAQGVTQTGQEVTAVVAANFTRGETCACIMARKAGADVFPVDLGVASPMGELGTVWPLIYRKISRGTKDFTVSPAMSRAETELAIQMGIHLVRDLKKKGYGLIATGEMGIGNTTTSAAVASVLLGRPPREVTGFGSGLSTESLEHKIRVIETGIQRRRPDPEDPLGVLSKVGGLDLAGLAGVFIGGAVYRIPVIVDGMISAAAALAAQRLVPGTDAYMMASHASKEPAGVLLLEALGLRPMIYGGLCLGEGTGAVALMPLLDMALAVYRQMSTFDQIQIEAYQPFDREEG